MNDIIEITGREILDSRGFPTLEVDVLLQSGIFGRASVPAGASKGTHEAFELRDGDKNRYKGRGVRRALELIQNTVKPALVGMTISDQPLLDQTLCDLDGTPNKSRLGANTLLAVSLACAHAAAAAADMPLFQYVGGIYAHLLPVPFINIINGGVHADNLLDIQEFMIVPWGAKSFAEAVRMGAEVFHTLREILHENKLSVNVGDEGGYAPQIPNTEEAIRYILLAIERAGYKAKTEIALALDVASTELYKDGRYHFSGEGKVLDSQGVIDFYAKLVEDFPIISIEDGMAEDDWVGWQALTRKLGDHVQLVGDDLFVTNPIRLRQGIEHKLANSVLIKPNQIGTLTETWDAIDTARRAAYTTIISHRSGESEDTTISDLAVGFSCGQIKIGSMCRSERTAKYNQLLRIEEQLGKEARYAGKETFLRIGSSPVKVIREGL